MDLSVAILPLTRRTNHLISWSTLSGLTYMTWCIAYSVAIFSPTLRRIHSSL